MRQIEEKDWNALKERIKAMLHDEQTSHVRSGRRMSFIDSEASVTERNKAITEALIRDLKQAKRVRSLSVTRPPVVVRQPSATAVQFGALKFERRSFVLQKETE